MWFSFHCSFPARVRTTALRMMAASAARFHGFRMGTLREDAVYTSSHSDPDYTSSSEQSCDTVIYVGANDSRLVTARSPTTKARRGQFRGRILGYLGDRVGQGHRVTKDLILIAGEVGRRRISDTDALRW